MLKIKRTDFVFCSEWGKTEEKDHKKSNVQKFQKFKNLETKEYI